MIARAEKAAESFEGFAQIGIDRVVAAMMRAGVANERKLAELAVEETGIGNVEDKVINIAELAGFSVPADVKLLMVPLTTTGPEDWMSHEKLSPVLGWFIVDSKEKAIAAAVCQIEFGGAGHSAVVFTENELVAKEFVHRVPANRVVWNQPSVHGTIGALYNDLVPSLTLGCGTGGETVPLKTSATKPRNYPPSLCPGGKGDLSVYGRAPFSWCARHGAWRASAIQSGMVSDW